MEQPSSESKRRGRFQFHLVTLIAVDTAAALLLWLNIRNGWPFRDILTLEKFALKHPGIDLSSVYVRQLVEELPPERDVHIVVLNILTCLAILFAIGWASECLLRRWRSCSLCRRQRESARSD